MKLKLLLLLFLLIVFGCSSEYEEYHSKKELNVRLKEIQEGAIKKHKYKYDSIHFENCIRNCFDDNEDHSVLPSVNAIKDLDDCLCSEPCSDCIQECWERYEDIPDDIKLQIANRQYNFCFVGVMNEN